MDRTRRPCVWLVALLGFFASACGEDNQTDPETRDVTPPGLVRDLVAERVADDSVLLRWSAPGDDEYVGRASQYEVRYYETHMHQPRWETALTASDPPTPGESGAVERLGFGKLRRGQWHFALKAADEEMNWSDLSNVAVVEFADTISPAMITDLELLSFDASSVTLTWTAPGDAGNEGRAKAYELRYARLPIITDWDWESATWAQGTPTPEEPGVRETFRVVGLIPNTPHHFAIRAWDDGGNRSPISNLVYVETYRDTIPPGPVTDLALTFAAGRSASFRWTAPGDNGHQGQAAQYDLRFSLDAITVENWDSATRCPDLPAPAMPGVEERFTAQGLDPDRTYYLALRTADRNGNVSELSNGVSATTHSLTVFPLPFGINSPQAPDWEPDGARIAFSARGLETQIHLVSAHHGGDHVQITDYYSLVSYPRWSPNGELLAVMARGPVNPVVGPSIALVEPEGEFDPIPVSPHHFGWGVGQPSWSPDGTRIAYSVTRGGLFPTSSILSVDVSGVPFDTLFSDGSRIDAVDWSPDGEQILFSSDRSGTYDLWLFPVAGGEPTALTNDPGKETQPRWSPDGAAIVFVSDRAGNSDLWTVAPSGGNWTQITSGPFDATYPAWSPDGRAIAFIHQEGGSTSRLAIQYLP